MKQHTLSFTSVPNTKELEQALLVNLEYYNVNNVTCSKHVLQFTTDLTLRGAELEYVLMGTRAFHARVNQDC